MMASLGILLGAGVLLFGIGWLYRLPSVAAWDEQIFLRLHNWLKPWLPFFRALWIFGTLWGILGIATAVAIWIDWRKALALLAAYGIVVLGEIRLKHSLARQRPFRTLPGVSMAQPHHPKDTSFPSGDALRIWLAAFALMAWLPPLWGWALIGIAVLVSLGRIALGVHHPLDVIAGTGLGMVAAALALALNLWLL